MNESDSYKRVRRAFGCAVEALDFKHHYDALSRKSKSTIDRIAVRELTASAVRYKLRNQISITHPLQTIALDDATFHFAEFPSLEIFYLFSCIDTFASSGFQLFPDWLRKAAKERKWPKEYVMEVDEVLAIYNEYSHTHGVGSNLRKFLNNLPAAVTDWLVNNVRVVQPNRVHDNMGESPLPSSQVIEHLFAYFYRRRRNPFAHESMAPFTVVATDIFHGIGWHRLTAMSEDGYSDITHHIGKQGWVGYVRTGVDEATILRMIIYGAALQYLHLDVTDIRIQSFFSNLSRQAAFYGFLEEVEYNAAMLRWWISYVGSTNHRMKQTLNRSGIPRLKTRWSRSVIDRYIVETPLESGMRQVTKEYLTAAELLNTGMDNIDKTYPPYASDPQPRHRVLVEFITEGVKSKEYDVVTQMPFHTVMEHVVHVADDPCYS